VEHTDALNRLSSDAERQTIAQVLTLWRATDQKLKAIAGNLAHEGNLSDSDHVDLLQELARKWVAHQNDAGATFKEYCDVCANYVLRGPPLTGQPVACAGRATPLKFFCEYLAKELRKRNPASPDSAQIRARLRRIVSAFLADPARAQAQLHRLLADLSHWGIQTLSRRPAWCIFVNPMRNLDPFAPPLHVAGTIANALGLEPDWGNWELLIFIYWPAPYAPLKKPTIADAEQHPYFTPCATGDEHGWTTPHDSTKPGIARQPEAVHPALLSRESPSKLLLATG
jgi:hypothetical protein